VEITNFASNDGDSFSNWFWSITVKGETRQGTIANGGNATEVFNLDAKAGQEFHATVNIYKPTRNGGRLMKSTMLTMQPCCCPPGQAYDRINRRCSDCPPFTQYCDATGECVPCRVAGDAVDLDKVHVFDPVSCECNCPAIDTVLAEECVDEGEALVSYATGEITGVDTCGVNVVREIVDPDCLTT
jgi:hypothetical protein